jgi:hypothetical protein
LIVFFVIATLVFAGLRMLLRHQSLSVRQFFSIYLATLAGLMLLFLGLTGRLHPLFAVIGAVLPFLTRMLPWIGRGNQAFSLFKYLRRTLGGSGGSSKGPAQSEISTRFLHVILIHDTGMMDGSVLEGSLSGSQLTDLNLAQLETLMDECRVDRDSLNILQAYLDREHPEWRDTSDTQSSPSFESGEMTRAQALEVLGLAPDASKEEIVSAHRKLMQKMHPDRGGSTYLAARINTAKDKLLEK